MSGEIDPKSLTREVLQMLSAPTAFSLEEIAGIIERRIEDRDRRLVAERDGWRKIAVELLQVAGLPSDGDIPPVEIVELRETRSLPKKNVAQLEQFWADLTRKHEDRRRTATSRGPIGTAIEAITAGSMVVLDVGAGTIRLWHDERDDEDV